ncbi:MAG: LemA family protein [Clostridia bacterium]|nr:LemA family protein [Clostridia bacterium]
MKNKKLIIIIAAILAVVVIIGGSAISSYNGLVTNQESVETAKANIDTMLQRRADLIPNVVDTVKAFAKHETEVFDKVLEARQNLLNANTIEEQSAANEELTTALQGINVIVENYPELKSDATYIGLMDELEGSENRIAVARDRYNEAVKEYNLKVKRFPGSIFAGIFGFEEAEYFEADAGTSEVPDVGAALGD